MFSQGRVFATISNRFRAARLETYRRDSQTRKNPVFKTGAKRPLGI
jgi:hypothetical protein